MSARAIIITKWFSRINIAGIHPGFLTMRASDQRDRISNDLFFLRQIYVERVDRRTARLMQQRRDANCIIFGYCLDE